MTDYTEKYAGNYSSREKYTALLDEGTCTPATVLDATGRSIQSCTFATPLAEGEPVALSNSSDNTFAATKGNILVERPVAGEALVIGKIVTIQKFSNFPAAATAADTLAERLSGGYRRSAGIELNFSNKIETVTIVCNGATAIVPGVGTTLLLDIDASTAAGEPVYAATAAGTGTGVIPLHAVPAGQNGDLYKCSVMYTGFTTTQA
jgi:hypothetical protein